MLDKIERKRVYNDSTGNSYSITINNRPLDSIVMDSPFGNCQVFGIKYFNTVVHNITDISLVHQVIRTIKDVCHIDKPLLQVDIRLEYYNKIKDYIKIFSEMPYDSLSGSKMVMLLIDTRK